MSLLHSFFCWGTVFRRRKDVAEVLRCPAETGE